MFIENRGEKGRIEHELGSIMMQMLKDTNIEMSRSEAFISLVDEIAVTERRIEDYNTVLVLWRLLHEHSEEEEIRWLNWLPEDYRNQVIKVWRNYKEGKYV